MEENQQLLEERQRQAQEDQQLVEESLRRSGELLQQLIQAAAVIQAEIARRDETRP